MIIRWLFAFLHLLALGMGLGGVWARSRALRGPLDATGLRRVFTADNWWGAAAGLWISTGIVRLFSPLEKGSAYYFHNPFFMVKMTAFVLILVLEVRPMVTFIRWRMLVRGGQAPDTRSSATFARTSAIQAVLVVVMVAMATAMARGLGASQ
jgi:putative membrane protein